MRDALGAETRPRTRSGARRTALADLLRDRAEPILERTVAETLRATDFVGLGATVAARYLSVSRGTLPLALAALGASDPERSRLLDEYSAVVTEVTRQGVPKFVQRGLTTLGFRIATGVARDSAHKLGFDPDELEDELRVFQRAFEARLFYGL